MKKKFVLFNTLIAELTLLLVALGLFVMSAYHLPEDMEETTGIVAEFHQYDEKWYDHIFGNSDGSYFSVRLTDGAYFETTGMAYGRLDRQLFEELQVGDEIGITYYKKAGGLAKICAVRCGGQVYLALEEVAADYGKAEKTARAIGASIIAASLLAGGVLLTINYRRNRKATNR